MIEKSVDDFRSYQLLPDTFWKQDSQAAKSRVIITKSTITSNIDNLLEEIPILELSVILQRTRDSDVKFSLDFN